MNKKLFVGNVSYDTTELELQDLFATCGPVEEVNLVMDRATGRPRGFAFVTMGTPEAAEQAIQTITGKNINGRSLSVTEARPREERGPRGGGGGGYGGGGGGGGYGGGGYGGGGGGGRGRGDRDRGNRGDRGDRGSRRERSDY